jgi:hypothetical protein
MTNITAFIPRNGVRVEAPPERIARPLPTDARVTHPCGLKLYTGTPDEDVLIAHWYLRMAHDGDLINIFTRNARTLRSLYQMTGPPKTLVYLTDAQGMWFATWGDSFMNGSFIGLWTRSDRRGTRDMVRAILDAFAWYLVPLPNLFVATKQRRLVYGRTEAEAGPLQRLGFRVLDYVPEWHDEDGAWLLRTDRETIHATLERFHRKWPWPKTADDPGPMGRP